MPSRADKQKARELLKAAGFSEEEHEFLDGKIFDGDQRVIDTFLLEQKDVKTAHVKKRIQRMKSIARKDDQAGYVGPSEGGMNSAAAVIPRENLCAGILNIAEAYGYCVVSAASMSGKTSVLQLCARMVQNLGHRAIFFSSDSIDNNETFPQAFHRQLQCTLSALYEESADKPTTYIFVDKGHLLFDPECRAEPLWRVMRLLTRRTTSTPSALRIVLSTIYGTRPSEEGSQAGMQEWQRRIPSEMVFNDRQIVRLFRTAEADTEYSEGDNESMASDNSTEAMEEDMEGLDGSRMCLALNEADFFAFVNLFKKTMQRGSTLNDRALLLRLLDMTSGIVGLVTTILTRLKETMSKSGRRADACYTLIHLLNSPSLYKLLSSQRSFIREVGSNSAEFKVLMKLILEGDRQCSLGVGMPEGPEGLLQAANKLMQDGLLYQNAANQFSFLCPLHRLFYFELLTNKAAGVADTAWNPETDLRHFCLRVVASMSSAELASSLTRGTAHEGLGSRVLIPEVLETQFHFFFSEHSKRLLPPNSLSPEVGGIFGTKAKAKDGGALDFYVKLPHNKAWGVEVSVDGGRAEDHASKFQKPEERYAKISMDDHVVLDFRSKVGKPKTLCEGFMYVVFESSDNFSTACVYSLGMTEQHIQLRP